MASERARLIAATWVALAAASCSSRTTSTVALALSPVPPDVKTISVEVFEIDRAMVVASATAASDVTAFDLEVPAETPLEFRVIARTDKPGPPTIGTMPAYFASSVRTIALGAQEIEVGLTLHRAGVLTLAAMHGPGISLDDLSLVFEEDSTASPSSVAFQTDALPDSFVARSGRYRVRIAGSDDQMRIVRGGRGLFVQPEIESIAIVDVETSTGTLDPLAPRALVLALLDDHAVPLLPPDVVQTASTGVVRVVLRIDAIDGNGRSVAVDGAMVDADVVADPKDTSPGSTVISANALPATAHGITFSGSGRFRIRAKAALADGRTIRGRLEGNALAPGVMPGLAEKMLLRVVDPDRLVQGTALAIDLVDGRGLYAVDASGALDLSGSDPWAYFPDGSGGAIPISSRGHTERRIARPSGPRGIDVAVRAVLTSTAIPGALTSTLAMPRLELP